MSWSIRAARRRMATLARDRRRWCVHKRLLSVHALKVSRQQVNGTAVCNMPYGPAGKVPAGIACNPVFYTEHDVISYIAAKLVINEDITPQSGPGAYIRVSRYAMPAIDVERNDCR